MRLGPWLVLRGALVGSLLVALFGYLVSAAFTFPQIAYAESPSLRSNSLSNETVLKPTVQAPQPSPPPAAVECGLSPKYPQKILQWCDLITKYGQTYNLDPNLIAALIWQESGGNSSAYSKSGAVGLMQVMPRDGIAATFMCQSGPCFSNRPSIDQLKDPEFNLKYGTRMLSGLINKYGSLREALKAYGPMNVGYYYADKVLGIYQGYGK